MFCFGMNSRSESRKLTLLYVSNGGQRASSDDEFGLIHRPSPVAFKEGLETANIPELVSLEKETDLFHDRRSIELSARVAVSVCTTGHSTTPPVGI